MVRWGRVFAWWGLAVAGISLAGLAKWLLPGGVGSLASTALSALAMLSPLAATVIVQRFDGEQVLADVGARPRASRWIGVAWVLPALLALLTLGISLLLPSVTFDPGMQGIFERFASLLTPEQIAEVRAQIDAMPIHPFWLGIPQALIAGITINALFAFGEEIGWRGWLHRELRPLGFWTTSLVTGVLWGLWHAPLILQGHNYPEHPVSGVAVFTVVTVLLSPVLSLVRERGDSVWAAAVFHGTFNAFAGLAMLVVRGPELLIGVQGLAGMGALLALNLLLWPITRRGDGAATTPDARGTTA